MTEENGSKQKKKDLKFDATTNCNCYSVQIKNWNADASYDLYLCTRFCRKDIIRIKIALLV